MTLSRPHESPERIKLSDPAMNKNEYEEQFDGPSNPAAIEPERSEGSLERVVMPPCACVHSDARTCARWRDGYDLDDPHYHPRDCICDCHSKDIDDDDDWN